MGFRHTIISESFPGNLPEWFKNKWKHYVNFQENSLLVASVDERKFYTDEFFKDYQKAVLHNLGAENTTVLADAVKSESAGVPVFKTLDCGEHTVHFCSPKNPNL